MTDQMLLDPKNDYVFKRVFGESPELLIALINDLRPDLPEIQSVEVLNPDIRPEELRGKYIILDIKARDAEGHGYNVEIQVRRYEAWQQRGLYYLVRMLSQQLDAGEDYSQLPAAVGIHLLDFDLFQDGIEQQNQAVWRFEMRDEYQPQVTLGNLLQLNLIELKKLDRLNAQRPSEHDDPITAWVTFFKHWREDKTMAQIEHQPVKQALKRIHELSADEEARRLAFVRERALHDEVTLLKEARERGVREGLERNRAALEQAEQEARRQHDAREQAEREARRQHDAREQAEREARRQHDAREQAEREARRQHDAREQAEQEARRQHDARKQAEQTADRDRAEREAALADKEAALAEIERLKAALRDRG